MPWAIKIAGAAVDLISLDFLPKYMCLPNFMPSSEKGCVRAHRTDAKTTALFCHNSLEEFIFYVVVHPFGNFFLVCPSIGKTYPGMPDQCLPFYLIPHNHSYIKYVK